MSYTANLFPSLGQFGIHSLNCNFNGNTYLVRKSPLGKNVLIIEGINAIEFVFAAANHNGWDATWIDAVEIRTNTNGISIWDR